MRKFKITTDLELDVEEVVQAVDQQGENDLLAGLTGVMDVQRVFEGLKEGLSGGELLDLRDKLVEAFPPDEED